MKKITKIIFPLTIIVTFLLGFYFLFLDNEEGSSALRMVPDLSEIDSSIKQSLDSNMLNQLSIKVIFNNHEVYSKKIDNGTPEILTGRDSVNLFDLASLTKVLATTALYMKIYEHGKINLDEKLNTFFPGYPASITIADLLGHTSGFPSSIDWRNCNNENDVRDRINRISISKGKNVLYSDVNFILLSDIIEKTNGKKFDEVLREEIYNPLKMKNTMFKPLSENRKNELFIVPSEKLNNGVELKGSVNDEVSEFLNGVAGHAGLFSTLEDVAMFCKMILNKGKPENSDKEFYKKETVEHFTRKINSERAIGWDAPPFLYSFAGNSNFVNAVGHTGYTGTSVLIDFDRDLIVIILSNSTYPDRSKRSHFINLRRQWHDVIVSGVDSLINLSNSVKQKI